MSRPGLLHTKTHNATAHLRCSVLDSSVLMCSVFVMANSAASQQCPRMRTIHHHCAVTGSDNHIVNTPMPRMASFLTFSKPSLTFLILSLLLLPLDALALV